MTTSRHRFRYIGGLALTLVFPTRTIEVSPGEEIELLPIEVERLQGRTDFENAVDQTASATPPPEPDPDADPNSEEIS
jgi:hypothetical protein